MISTSICAPRLPALQGGRRVLALRQHRRDDRCAHDSRTPPLPGGYASGRSSPMPTSRKFIDDKLAYGQAGEVTEPATLKATPARGGRDVPGKQKLLDCHLNGLSRAAPPPLPGGYVVGEKVFFAGVNKTLPNGDKVTHGQAGEVFGPAATTGTHVAVDFPGSKNCVDCALASLSRAAPPPLPGGYAPTTLSSSSTSGAQTRMLRVQQGWRGRGPATGPNNRDAGVAVMFTEQAPRRLPPSYRLSSTAPPPPPGGWRSPATRSSSSARAKLLQTGQAHVQQGWRGRGPSLRPEAQRHAHAAPWQSPGNKDKINCYLKDHSRAPPPLPGGWRRRREGLLRRRERTFRRGKLMYSKAGEVVGLLPDPNYKDTHVVVAFPGNKVHRLPPCDLSRAAAAFAGRVRRRREGLLCGVSETMPSGDKSVRQGRRGRGARYRSERQGTVVAVEFSGNRVMSIASSPSSPARRHHRCRADRRRREGLLHRLERNVCRRGQGHARPNRRGQRPGKTSRTLP